MSNRLVRAVADARDVGCHRILLDHARKNGGFVHCPNGHSIGWNQGEVKRELERTKLDLEGYKKRNATLSSQVSCLENSNRSFKAANTRLKNKMAS